MFVGLNIGHFVTASRFVEKKCRSYEVHKVGAFFENAQPYEVHKICTFRKMPNIMRFIRSALFSKVGKIGKIRPLHNKYDRYFT